MNIISLYRLLRLPVLYLVATAASVFSTPPQSIKDDFDRLDGKGPSQVRVDVIEWDDNLEIHVYPKGSLAGLALVPDRRTENRPVMVIGYRFKNAPEKQLIRRAILGIPISDSFQAFRDPTPPDYDKIVISNQSQSRPLVRFSLDPAPAALYPEGHPALARPEGNSPDREPAHRKAVPQSVDTK